MILFLPFGATSGFVSVTWAPLPDMLFTRRGWYLVSNLVSSITLILVGFVPVVPDTMAWLRTLLRALLRLDRAPVAQVDPDESCQDVRRL